MGIFLRIQRFVDNLDVSSKYYYCLLFSEFLLIAIVLRLKGEVFANEVIEEKHVLTDFFVYLAKIFAFNI